MVVSLPPRREVETPTALKRPLGVALLAIFYILGGLSLITTGTKSLLGGTYNYEFYVGFVFLALGWGMWKGKGWAWNLFLIDVIATFILVALSSLTIPIPFPYFVQVTWSLGALALDVLFFYYITRKEVKAFFGKVSVRTEFT